MGRTEFQFLTKSLRKFSGEAEKTGPGPPHSTLPRNPSPPAFRQVLECGGPTPLFLPQSKLHQRPGRPRKPREIRPTPEESNPGAKRSSARFQPRHLRSPSSNPTLHDTGREKQPDVVAQSMKVRCRRKNSQPEHVSRSPLPATHSGSSCILQLPRFALIQKPGEGKPSQKGFGRNRGDWNLPVPPGWLPCAWRLSLLEFA